MRGILSISASTTALALILSAVPVAAQSAGTWSLPEPTGTPTPRSQGPVDAQNPVVSAPTASPSARPSEAAPAPAPSQAPRIVAPAPESAPVIRPAPIPSAAPRAEATRPASVPAATPTPTPSEAQPAPSAAPEPTYSESAAPEATPSEASAPASETSSPQARESWPVWWWAGAFGLIAVTGGAFALLRRRRATPGDQDWTPEPEPVAEPAAEPATPTRPALQPDPAPPAPVASEPAFTPAPVIASADLSLEPVGLRLSLVYATLQYRVTIASATDLPAGHLLGDMIGAHGSIPPEDQLAPAIEALTPLKPVPALTAGESVTLTGEIQLPLGAIRPVRQGNASLFVPLVRLTLTAGDHAVRRIFTVGTAGSEALAPLRLDTGPREHRDLASREVEAARAYPVNLQGLRQAG